MQIGDVIKYAMNNTMEMILIAVCLIAIAILLKVQFTKDNFDLRSVIADEKGQPSIHKIGQLTALVFSTWLLVYLALHNLMGEGYFGTYMGVWAAAQAADKWMGRRDGSDQQGPTGPG
jgi:hypothetical protein